MIHFVLISNAVIIFTYSIFALKKYCDKYILYMFSLASSLISSLYIYCMYFILYQLNYMIFVLIALLLVFVIFKHYIFSRSIIVGFDLILFEKHIYNSFLVSIQVVGVFLGVILMFPNLMFVFQLMIMIALQVVIVYVRRFSTRLFKPSSILLMILSLFTLLVSYRYRVFDKDYYQTIPKTIIHDHFYISDEVIEYEYLDFIISILDNEDYIYQVVYEYPSSYRWDMIETHFEIVDKNNGTKTTVLSPRFTSYSMNGYIDLVEFQGTIYLNTVYGLYSFENNNLNLLIALEQTETVKTGILYLHDNVLIYENSDGVYEYENGDFTLSTSIQSVIQDNYVYFSYQLHYYYYYDCPLDETCLIGGYLFNESNNVIHDFGYYNEYYVTDLLKYLKTNINENYNYLEDDYVVIKSHLGEVVFEKDNSSEWDKTYFLTSPIVVYSEADHDLLFMSDGSQVSFIHRETNDYIIIDGQMYVLKYTRNSFDSFSIYFLKASSFIMCVLAVFPMMNLNTKEEK